MFKIVTEEDACNAFLKGDSSLYGSDTIIIEKIIKGGKGKGVIVSVNGRKHKHFINQNGCLLDVTANGFCFSNYNFGDYKDTNDICVEVLKRAGLYKFETYYKG